SSGVADVTFSRGCTAGVGSFAVVVTSGDLGDVAAIAAVAAVAALTAGRAGAAGAASTTVSESGCARHGGEAQGAHGHDNRFPDLHASYSFRISDPPPVPGRRLE